MTAPAQLPMPTGQPIARHLGRWGTDPLGLLDDGARLGSVFTLKLWRDVTVGYSPEWNRLVLGDLETFQSKGSMSGLSPYLAGGVVLTDAPKHRDRRKLLNPGFQRGSVGILADRVSHIARDCLPTGEFNVAEWTSAVTRQALAAVFFDGEFSAELLQRFLDPLDKKLPAPFLRRPRLFRRMNAQLRAAIDSAVAPSLANVFAGLDGGVEELRVVLSAGYDTTAHTLAWMLWHLVDNPDWCRSDSVDAFIQEILRLYPAGWVGSRICRDPTDFGEFHLPAGSMVLYSPYLTHRDPQLWNDPLEFRPERFAEALPAWGYLPFAAGERTCLGTHLAKLMLRELISPFHGLNLERVEGNTEMRAGITLAPKNRLRLRVA